MNFLSAFGLSSLLFVASCSFSDHMPRVPVESNANDQIVSMKVGERRKVMSKQVLSEFNMGYLMPPSFYMKSSNPQIISIDGDDDRVAWVEALRVGQADILYHSASEEKTTIKVIP